MNKYQKAIGSLRWSAELCNLCDMDDVDTLQELVEKATPKKPERTIQYFGGFTIKQAECSECGNFLCNTEDYCYCPNCGQAIDWS